MSARLNKLREQREALIVDAEKLLAKADAENRDFNKEELETYGKIEEQLTSVNARIEREERHAEREAQLDHTATKVPGEPASAPDKREAPGQKPAGFGNFGEFLMAVRQAAEPGADVDPRLSTRAASGLGESVPSDGGFLVAKEFATELLKRAYDTGQLVSKVRRIPIGAGKNGLTINAVAETSRVDGSRWGGILSYWQNEADQKTATKPKFRQMEMQLKKLTGLCYATDELLEDSQALESVISQAFAEEFGFQLDAAIVRGSGAGQPLGILNCGALVTQAAEGGQAADTIVYKNIVKMYSRLWSRSNANAVWLAHQDTVAQLAIMQSDVGAPVWIANTAAAGAPPQQLMGRPINYIEQCSALGDVGDIMLVDLSQYLLIEKSAMQSAMSMHVRFIYDESVFRFVLRVDGQPIWDAALTPYKGSNTQSPFITLAAR